MRKIGMDKREVLYALLAETDEIEERMPKEVWDICAATGDEKWTWKGK